MRLAIQKTAAPCGDTRSGGFHEMREAAHGVFSLVGVERQR